jgi:low temperature requirement protein LtrA
MDRVRREPSDEDEEVRASVVELFFDLVFVLVVTRLSALLIEDLTIAGAARTLFLLLVAWWAWIYTTWATNWFDPETGPVRAVLLLGMLASMFGAIAIPDAFGHLGLLLVGGYVAMQSVRNGFAVLATEADDPLHPALVRIFAWNAWVGLIWLAGALLHGDARVAVWLVALVCDYAGPLVGHWTPGRGRSSPREWEMEPSHFVERLELFVLIALGESIVAAGVTASDLALTAERFAAVAVAFAITVAVWWLYFDFHAEHALTRLRAAADERGRIGRDLSYIHVPLVAGIIVAAVANELVIQHPGDVLAGEQLAMLAGGPALYLLGSVGFKLRVIHFGWGKRLVAMALVAGVAVLGTALPALATWTLVLAVLTGLAVLEWFELNRAHGPAHRRRVRSGARSRAAPSAPRS